ncbi:origin recognition complex subunit 6-domain-containing protein [Geopyxis carbonaria]|nr:origin recognition complex subunit 6-domain-containing protein [Geopyxis carbonaria]
MSTDENALHEANLHSILPELAGLLPPELLAVTSSLYAQSHTRISNLKPTEEPARAYVCAQLACERLKDRLALPTLAPRPPLPPRVYASLLAHFRKALVSARPKPVAVGGEELDGALRTEISAWMKALHTEGAEAHVLRGVAAVLVLHRKVTARQTVYAVVCAVTLLALERMSTPDGAETCGDIRWVRNKGYTEKRNEVMRVMAAGKGRVQRETVDHWVKELSTQGFGKWGWMRDIPNGVGFGIDAVGKTAADTAGAGKGKDAARRAATRKVPVAVAVRRGAAARTKMVQDKVDYLSDRKRAGYKDWKKEVLRRCEQIEADERCERVEAAAAVLQLMSRGGR